MKRKKLLDANLRILILILPCLLFLLCPRQAGAENPGSLTAHFLDVGEGLCVLLESDGAYALYDGGGPDSSQYVVSYLKAQGVERLDLVIASHYDLDHISGLIGVLHVFPVLEVWGPDYEIRTNIYSTWMNEIREQGYLLYHPSQDETRNIGNARIRVVSDGRWHEKENDRSIVISVSQNDSTLLIPGDLTSDGEQELIAEGKDLSSDILVLGHHGSGSSTSWKFLTAVNPSCVLLSCGSGNEWGHPSKRTMERVTDLGAALYRTDRQGTVTAVFLPGGRILWNTPQSDDYSAGVYDPSSIKETSSGISEDVTYILNGSSWKFHRPECELAAAISPKNRVAFTGTREEALELGYDPCKKCRP